MCAPKVKFVPTVHGFALSDVIYSWSLSQTVILRVVRVKDVVIVVDGHSGKGGQELGGLALVGDEELPAELVDVSLWRGEDGPVVHGGSGAVLAVDGVDAGDAIRLEYRNRDGRLEVPSADKLKYDIS